ncbi:hypothetical protein E4V99_10715 [Microbacterium sp. dk485]|uniref:hypothetical protein n=1 Tax=Microbacterium sp. dk485 TaxID=2560021 RepID=UPI0010739822|nr:hypothetical protein [Microbacterium sp. dk485]TFV81469.1 hypothetical protein E4V99_10715 [Microbacterium sp. dk485]
MLVAVVLWSFTWPAGPRFTYERRRAIPLALVFGLITVTVFAWPVQIVILAITGPRCNVFVPSVESTCYKQLVDLEVVASQATMFALVPGVIAFFLVLWLLHVKARMSREAGGGLSLGPGTSAEERLENEAPRMKQARPRAASGRWPSWVLVGTAIIAGTVSAAAVLALDRPHRWGVGAWISDFAKSPGIAGVFAVAAASLALWGILRQVAVARSSLSHQQTIETERSWWTRFEWASTRAVPSDPTAQPLPWNAVLSTFNALAVSAQDDVQRTAVGAIMEVAGRTEQTSESHRKRDVVSAATEGRPSVSALESYVHSTAGTPASSPVVEALLYEAQVLEALKRVFGDSLNLPARERNMADALVVRGQVQVAVEIRNFSETAGPVSTDRLLAQLKTLRDVSGAAGAVVVAPGEIPYTERAPAADIRVVKWTSPEDDEALRLAVDSIVGLPPAAAVV